MKAFFAIICFSLSLSSVGCMAPITDRLDGMNAELIRVNAQLKETNDELVKANVQLQKMETVLKRFGGGQEGGGRQE